MEIEVFFEKSQASVTVGAQKPPKLLSAVVMVLGQSPSPVIWFTANGTYSILLDQFLFPFFKGCSVVLLKIGLMIPGKLA